MEQSSPSRVSSCRDYYYVPGSGAKWEMVKLLGEESLAQESEIENKGIATDFKISGFCKHKDGDPNYSVLLDELGVWKLSNSEIIGMVKSYLFNNEHKEHSVCPYVIPSPRHLRPQDPDWADIIYDVVYLKKNPGLVSWKRKVDKSDLRRKVHQYKMNLRIVKRDNRKFLGKGTKRTPSILNLCKKFCEEKKYKAFSAHDLRVEVQKADESLEAISVSTVRRILDKDLNMSYKKVNLINQKIGSPANKRELCEAIGIQTSLMISGVEVIYIDEFKYSGRQSHQYTWNKRGCPGHFKSFPSKFQASFMMAVSQTRIHGVMANEGTYNQSHFKFFLGALTSSTRGRYTLILDNARIHVSKMIREFCEKNGICLILIPAYCPFVNMCEKAILSIKSKIRRLQREGKEIRLETFKKCLDGITVKELERCVRASFIETIKIVT